jgi:tetratricopeptide (TPR) repeat protein
VRLLWAIALLGFAAPAWADSDAEIARAHFATGLGYYDSGRYAEAVREFLEANRLSPLPALLFNIGRTYDRAGDPPEAVRYYRRYLEAAPEAIERGEVERRLGELEHRVGRLEVRASVPAAEVLVDGKLVGRAPIAGLTLSAGRHELAARAEGWLTAHRTIDVVGGDRASVSLALERPRRTPRWVWPVAAVGAAVVAGVAIALGLVFGTTDLAQSARAGCTGAGCALIDLAGTR